VNSLSLYCICGLADQKGRFAVRDMRVTVAVGIIKSVSKGTWKDPELEKKEQKDAAKAQKKDAGAKPAAAGAKAPAKKK